MKAYFLQSTESRDEARTARRAAPRGETGTNARPRARREPEPRRADRRPRPDQARRAPSPRASTARARSRAPASASWAACPARSPSTRCMDEPDAIPVPANLSWEDAAAMPVTFLVVYDMLVPAGRPESRRMAARHRRLLRRRRRGLAGGKGARREGDRHFRLCGKAAEAEVAWDWTSPSRRETRISRSKCLKRPEGKESTWSSTTSAARSSPRRSSASPTSGRHATVGYLDGVLRGEARHRGAAFEAPEAVRRLEQAADGAAARRDGARLHEGLPAAVRQRRS